MKNTSWLLFIGVLTTLRCSAVDIGSDTAVSRLYWQQLLSDGDRVAGFAALEGGFFIDALSTATFDSYFPVSGKLDFNFATMILNQDLITHGSASLGHWGSIMGHGHSFELARSLHCLPGESSELLCVISLVDQVVEAASVQALSFSYDNAYLAEAVGTNLSVDLIVGESSLVNQGTISVGQTIWTVDWHPSNDWIAVGSTTLVRTYTFNRGTGALTLIDSITLGNDVRSVAWHPSGGHLAVGWELDNELIVYTISGTGTFGASTSVNLAADVNAVDWNSTGTYLAAGLDASPNEFRIYSFTTAPLGLSLNATFEVGVYNIWSVSWNKNASSNDVLAIGLSAGNTLRLFRHNGGVGSLTELSTGISLSTVVNSVHWHPCGCCLAAGLDQNSEGTGGEVRLYSFNNATGALSQSYDTELNDNVNSVRWSPDERLFAKGDEGVGVADPVVALYRYGVTGIDTGSVIFDNVHMVLNGNATFDFTPIEFTGESSIDGRGSILSFSPTFSIVIESNSSLLFKNITLAGLNSNKLSLTDSTSTVSFQGVRMAIDEDFYFTQGCFEVLSDFVITGDHIFIYQSPCTSSILSRLPEVGEGSCQAGFSGSLIMDIMTTFSYDTTISSTLIHMEEEYAKFIFNSATLATTGSMHLTNGRVLFDGKCRVIGGDGVIFGDGVDAENNCYVEILPGARVDVESGYMIDNNVR